MKEDLGPIVIHLEVADLPLNQRALWCWCRKLDTFRSYLLTGIEGEIACAAGLFLECLGAPTEVTYLTNDSTWVHDAIFQDFLRSVDCQLMILPNYWMNLKEISKFDPWHFLTLELEVSRFHHQIVVWSHFVELGHFRVKILNRDQSPALLGAVEDILNIPGHPWPIIVHTGIWSGFDSSFRQLLRRAGSIHRRHCGFRISSETRRYFGAMRTTEALVNSTIRLHEE